MGLVLLSATAFGQKVRTFTVSRTIAAPATKVWAVVGDDFGAIANSHPKIVSSNYVQGTLKSGEGAERVCNLNESGTKYVKEKQVNYDPANYTFTAQVYHVDKLPLDPEKNAATYKVNPVGDDKSELIFTMNFLTNPAFMGALFKGKFMKNIEDYLLAVEHHVLTGEVVNQDNFKSIKKQYKN